MGRTIGAALAVKKNNVGSGELAAVVVGLFEARLWFPLLAVILMWRSIVLSD